MKSLFITLLLSFGLILNALALAAPLDSVDCEKTPEELTQELDQCIGTLGCLKSESVKIYHDFVSYMKKSKKTLIECYSEEEWADFFCCLKRIFEFAYVDPEEFEKEDVDVFGMPV